MEKLKKQKNVLERMIKRHKEKVLSKLEDSDSVALQLFERKTQEIASELKILFDSIFETCKAKDEDGFIDEKESLENEIDQLILAINRKLTKVKPIPEAPFSGNSVSSISEVKLPTLSVPTFHGKIENWMMFKDLFTASVIDNKSISNAMKLQYLKASCKDEALRVIHSISISDANFEIAWKLLEDRYSNKRELVNSIIRKLLNLPSINESSSAILNLIDVANECVRSLAILDYKVENLSETMLVFIIVDKLDKSTRYWWEKELKNSDELGTLNQLLLFLQNQARTLQNSKIKESKRNVNPQQRVSTMVAASSSKNLRVCVKCRAEEFHGLYKCPEFINLSVNDRCEFVKKHNLCFNCLKNHAVKNCASTFRCQKCRKRHSTLLHFEKPNTAEGVPLLPSPQSDVPGTLNPNAMSFDPQTVPRGFTGTSVDEVNRSKTVLLSTAVVFIKDRLGNLKPVRALMDVGSMSNFITLECAESFRMQRDKVSVAVSGLNDAKVSVKSKVWATISNGKDFEVQLEFLCVPKISNAIPASQIKLPVGLYPQNMKLADPGFNKPGKVDILLGAEVFYQLLKAEQIQIPNSELRYQNSVFGFVAAGSVYNSEHQEKRTVHCGLAYNCCDLEKQIQKFWNLEALGIKDDPSYNDDDEALNLFEKTVTYKNGRYEVELPWKRDWKELNDNFDVAFKRLNSLLRRMQRDENLNEQYCETLRDYESKNIIEKVLDPEKPKNRPVYYLPHQPVFRDDSLTTKMRIVFDASSSQGFHELSLNDCLWPGPNLNSKIFDLLVNFRLHKVAFLADIEKAFLQIILAEKDRDAVRFLWKKNGVLQIYRFNRVLFGVTSSPFLLSATIRTHLKKFQDQYPATTEILDHCLYVDDFVGGSDTIQEAMKISKEAVSIMKEAGMVLRKWVTNDNSLMKIWAEEGVDIQPNHNPGEKRIHSAKVLGMSWNIDEDSFVLGMQSLDEMLSKSENSKRFLLRAIGKIFDPLGLLTPFTIRVKCMLQKLWMMKVSWDEELPPDIHEIWVQWCAEVPRLAEVKIPRDALNSNNGCIIELHCFCDASQSAYGACIYVRVLKNQGPDAILLASKSRVAPLKKITLPRLELLGALLAARLGSKIKSIVDLKCPSRLFFWTDSKITLYWIKGSSKRWKSFVANRVDEIQSLSDKNAWAHCPGNQNPADLLSRGISVDALLSSSLWWKGPPFLRDSDLPSDCDQISIPLTEVSDELRKTFELERDCDSSPVVLTAFHETCVLDDVLSISKNYFKTVRILCYVLRFIYMLKGKRECAGSISNEEFKRAEHTLIRYTQKALDRKTMEGLSNLKPFVDKYGIVRVGGRLMRAEIPYDQKFPIILPKNCKLSEKLFFTYHLRFLHIGPQGLLNAVRLKFWPVGGRNLARSTVRSCVTCFKNKPLLSSQIMADLPKERVASTYAFNCTGLDLCGPFYVTYKNQRKGSLNKIYVCVFICFSTKAIHLEVLSDLTSSALIATLKRFCARRGKPSKIYSDNGTNMVGAKSELDRWSKLVRAPKDELSAHLTSESINWHFIPPRSPHFGGLWEAGVKSVKHHLIRAVGNSRFTYEEFETILIEIEGILNSRPLTPLSSDTDSYEVLTPGHFLIGRSLSAIPEPEVAHLDENRLSRWQRTSKVVQTIWKKWKNDYLNTLQQRSKWIVEKQNLSLGSMVLIKENFLPCTKWLLGRIIEVLPGSDGKVRVVKVRTQNGEYKRAITEIAVLPIET